MWSWSTLSTVYGFLLLEARDAQENKIKELLAEKKEKLGGWLTHEYPQVLFPITVRCFSEAPLANLPPVDQTWSCSQPAPPSLHKPPKAIRIDHGELSTSILITKINRQCVCVCVRERERERERESSIVIFSQALGILPFHSCSRSLRKCKGLSFQRSRRPCSPLQSLFLHDEYYDSWNPFASSST